MDEYLINLDNCKDLSSSTYLEHYCQLQQNPAATEEFWRTLLRTQFEDDTILMYFIELSEEQRSLYFKFGVDCVVTFVQANFTGPELPQLFTEFLNKSFFDEFDFRRCLSVDDEINVNTKYPALLVAAKCIFKFCKWNKVLNLWWQWRTLMLHQRILDDLSPTLLTEVEQLEKQLQQHIHLNPCRPLLEIEQAQLYQLYRNVSQSEYHLDKAGELLGIKHKLLGALGKRTKYQNNDIAQLRLLIEVNENYKEPEVEEFLVPKDITLDDDVRLNTVKFNTDIILPNISDIQQKYLVATIQHLQISQPRDNFYYEEIKPYLDYILSQKNTWTVRVMVLLIRCKLESAHKRTVERSFLQCEDIVRSFEEVQPHMLNRIGGIFSTGFFPKWEVEAQLAELMLNTGLIKASLDIYLKLELWEEVIVCYTLLKLRHKAAEIIKQRLDARPTVKLWCLLGDATDDVRCYDTAWQLSEERSARAQRHWGEYFYIRKEYLLCIPHYEKSVSINPLQTSVWLRYGFAALETENWETAATAYKRYTMLEGENFEAWNNLAKAYIKLGKKHAAFEALRDAIKYNFDNWKVWDNLMVVSVDVKNFSEVVNAYHRILDIKGKHLELDVLERLVLYVVTQEFNGTLLKRTRELLGRLTSIYSLEGFLWSLYAELAEADDVKVQRLQRAYRGTTQVGWEKSLERCQEALSICNKMGHIVLTDGIKVQDPLMNNVRLNLSGCLATIKRQNYDSLFESAETISLLLQQIIDKCKSSPCQES